CTWSARRRQPAIRSTPRRPTMTARRDHYRNLSFMNPYEIVAMAAGGAAAEVQAIGQATMEGAAAGYQMPTVTVGSAGSFGSPVSLTTAVDGKRVGDSIKTHGDALGTIATLLREGAAMSASLGGYTRRQEEWDLQATLADKELIQIQKQLDAADIRQALAA